MGKEIFNVAGMADALRYTEYKNVYSALSELVDNSIEAKAQNIFIILRMSADERNDSRISQIAILDDGTGMNDETLQDCLVFGSTTKSDRKSMGRFGVGLGQASLFAAPRVEVYSWQNGNHPKYVYLDTNLMRNGEQNRIPSPIVSNPPEYFISNPTINYSTKTGTKSVSFEEKGTLVLWDEIDTSIHKVVTFRRRIREELGRRFRYYLEKGINIFVTDTGYNFFEKIEIIDPLFLMESSSILGDLDNNTLLSENGEPLFEPFISKETPEGVRTIRILLDRYGERRILGNVNIRASLIKEKFYYSDDFRKFNNKNPGDTEIGKLLKKYENISVLRAEREIQFEKAGLYDSTNTPTNRWWSIEIDFDPSLDEFFKLSNNKQKVEFDISHYDNFLKNKRRNSKISLDYLENSEEKYWIEIVMTIKSLIKLMTSRNEKLAREYKRMYPKQTKNELTDHTSTPYQSLETREDLAEENKLEDFVKESIKKDSNLQSRLDILIDEEIDEKDNYLFFIREDCNYNFKSILNYQHEIFNFFESLSINMPYEVALKIVIYSLKNIQVKKVTFSEKKMFEAFIVELNDEINKTIQFLIEGSEQSG